MRRHLRAVRAWLGRLASRPAAAPSFAGVLAQTLRDRDAITLRLSTVERSVGIDLDRPQLRASRED